MDTAQTVGRILDAFERFRMPPTAIDKYEETGKTLLACKIMRAIYACQPIRFSMLGYPFKSPNHRDKTLGDLPDLAEESSFQNLNTFAHAVQEIYAPGAVISLVSDGFAFNDEFRVPDRNVDAYAEAVQDMTRGLPIQWFTMRDFYKQPIGEARQKLIEQWAPTETELERRILQDVNVNWLYRGMLKFMDAEAAIWPFDSNSARRREVKATVRRMMLLNEAYSTLMAKEFSDHIRLSMHKSDNSGTKYSFQLIPGHPDKIWTSPWHAALLRHPTGELETIHRKDADAAGLPIVYINGRAYFYEKVS